MLFQVKAIRGDTEIIRLPVEAPDADGAARLTREQGYGVLAVKAPAGLTGVLRSGRGDFSVLFFTQELIALLEAGLNLVAALETLVEKESAPHTRRVLQRVLERLYHGATLSAALEEFPHVFSPLYIATVRSNERTSGLVEALTRYVRYQLQLNQVRSKLAGALIYPALLLTAGGGVTLFLLFYVVPRFRHVFEDMNTELPFFSRLLVRWGGAVENHGLLIAVVIVAAVGAVVFALSQPALRERAVARFAALPGVGERFQVYQFARFYRTLGMLQRSGMPLASALDIAAGMLTGILRPAIGRAGRAVREGTAFSVAMQQQRLATPVAYRLLVVAEHGGNMPEMLDRIASFHEEQLARWVDWFTRLFEPLLMAGIGIVIGLIVIFLYMPIFELAGSIQ